MARPNPKAVGRFYAAWNDGDLPGMLRLVDPAVSAELPIGLLCGQHTYRGRDGITAFFAEVAARWEHAELRVEDVQRRGDVVTALVRLDAHRRGEAVAGRIAVACTFRRRRIVSIQRTPVPLRTEPARAG